MADAAKIRIVEDNQDLAFGLSTNLEVQGYEVTLAEDGPTGLELALSDAPDLIILDEFPRFAEMLDTADTNDDWTRRLARRLFNYDTAANAELTRVLLLSATPYRMYTRVGDSDGDDHYADFMRTARFLFDSADDPDAEVEGWR